METKSKRLRNGDQEQETQKLRPTARDREMETDSKRWRHVDKERHDRDNSTATVARGQIN